MSPPHITTSNPNVSGQILLKTILTADDYSITIDDNVLIYIPDTNLEIIAKPILITNKNQNHQQLETNASITLNPGNYTISIQEAALIDATDNVSTQIINHAFTVNYPTIQFSPSNPNFTINNQSLTHIIDISQAIPFAPFDIDDLIITCSSTYQYLESINYIGNGNLELKFTQEIENISYLDFDFIYVPINISFENKSSPTNNTTLATDVKLEINYRNPTIIKPSSKTLTKKTGETVSYTINHPDTAINDLSFTVVTDESFQGTISTSLSAIDNISSYLNISFELTSTDKNTMAITITAKDINSNVSGLTNSNTIIDTIIFDVPYIARSFNNSTKLFITFDKT